MTGVQGALKQQVERDKALAEEAARSALRELFPALGISPETATRDISKLLAARALLDDDEFAQDLAWVRRLRTTSGKIADAGIATTVKILVTFMLGIVALGTKDWWLKHITG